MLYPPYPSPSHDTLTSSPPTSPHRPSAPFPAHQSPPRPLLCILFQNPLPQVSAGLTCHCLQVTSSKRFPPPTRLRPQSYLLTALVNSRPGTTPIWGPVPSSPAAVCVARGQGLGHLSFFEDRGSQGKTEVICPKVGAGALGAKGPTSSHRWGNAGTERGRDLQGHATSQSLPLSSVCL